MKSTLKVPEFESQSGLPDGTLAEQQEWIARAIIEVISLAEALPFEPAAQHDLPARPIHR